MAYPISSELLVKELTLARDVLDKWVQKHEAGIPMIEAQGSEESLEAFVSEFVGELRLISAKCDALAEIVHEATSIQAG